jgi:glycerol-3-phosphate O-acyltransferase/dihydroxyacetone phosphate acyltransferase
MALGELAAKPGSRISVVPCGLNYSQGATFRSRVLVEFGQPVKISPELVERYRSGKESEAVQELLEDINRSLLAVTFSTPNNDIRSVSIHNLGYEECGLLTKG